MNREVKGAAYDPRIGNFIEERGADMDNTITISRGEYELLIRAKAKNELVKAVVMADTNKYGLGDDTKYALELILGINNIEKAD